MCFASVGDLRANLGPVPCAFLAKSCLRLKEFVRVATMVGGPVVSTEVIFYGALY